MAKNIVIAEGGTAKNFTAKKLQTNLQGSGRVNWIPEDEAVDYVNLKDHIFHEAGTFKPEDFNCDGFGEVTIDIPADVKPKTITENGEFYAADDGCLGYSKVTVAVPAGGGGGPYTVRFFGDDYETILKTDANVPYRGSASCTDLDGTVLNGLYFKGWNPSPTNVTGDMNCYPVRGDYVIDPNEIRDDWETICADGGAHYDLGAYKSLVLTIPEHTFDVVRKSPTDTEYDWSIPIPQQTIAMHMVKVAEGEDGSSSSWISTGTILNKIQYLNSFSMSFLKTEMAFDWANIPLREWLNNVFLRQLPLPLQDTIKQVNKSYIGATNYYAGAKSNAIVEKTSLDKIWVPSTKELYTRLTAYPNFGGVHNNGGWYSLSSYTETNGIDYSAIYVPTYTMYNNAGYFLRSCIYDNTYGAGGNDRGTSIGALLGTSNYDNYAPGFQLKEFSGISYGGVPFGFCL